MGQIVRALALGPIDWALEYHTLILFFLPGYLKAQLKSLESSVFASKIPFVRDAQYVYLYLFWGVPYYNYSTTGPKPYSKYALGSIGIRVAVRDETGVAGVQGLGIERRIV